MGKIIKCVIADVIILIGLWLVTEMRFGGASLNLPCVTPNTINCGSVRASDTFIAPPMLSFVLVYLAIVWIITFMILRRSSANILLGHLVSMFPGILIYLALLFASTASNFM